ncbi:MAG: hypothetical protein AD073_000183 [Mycoplasmataceae bacterium]|nr:MAG: hypothetical protein AD073_000183 [Mycoplasmataceae bacterium]
MSEDFICNLKLRYENNDKFNHIEIENILDNEKKWKKDFMFLFKFES